MNNRKTKPTFSYSVHKDRKEMHAAINHVEGKIVVGGATQAACAIKTLDEDELRNGVDSEYHLFFNWTDMRPGVIGHEVNHMLTHYWRARQHEFVFDPINHETYTLHLGDCIDVVWNTVENAEWGETVLDKFAPLPFTTTPILDDYEEDWLDWWEHDADHLRQRNILEVM